MKTRPFSLRHLRIAAFAAGAAAVAGAAVLVTASAAGFSFGLKPASSAQPATASLDTSGLAGAASPSAICSAFLSHFAGDLGKSQADVNSAFQKAIGQTLADEVKNGTLTQAQADAITKKLANRQPCTLAGALGKRHAPGAGMQLRGYMGQLITAAASALGISDTQLKTDLASGMTLSQIAAAQTPPVTEAQFRTRLIAQLKPLLDQAVTSGKLSSTQEQTILQRLQTGPIPFWSTPLRRQPAPAPANPATT